MRPSYPIISWFDKSTILHLRFPFSFYLLPIYLFAFSQAEEIAWFNAIVALIVLHFLVYPSSSGYNSYEDQDETSIGGLKYPPKVSSNLYYATLLMDVTAVLAAMLVSLYFSVMTGILILVSRAYSYRKIRLKKFPVLGFITVAAFQGGFAYFLSLTAISADAVFSRDTIMGMVISTLFIGGLYPLTQIYQHEADARDGVITISCKLGYVGTFVFSGILFLMAAVLLSFHFVQKQQPLNLLLFGFLMLPVVYYMFFWFMSVKKDYSAANFENAMRMNNRASLSMSLFFFIAILRMLF
jgi:1,4-dihydroxy-2-naphthoate octaprenyltransferase